MKLCVACSLEKPLDEFSPGCGTHGRHTYCRTCNTKKARKWLNQNKERRLDWFYRRLYGLSLEQVKAMYAAAGGRCQICDREVVLARGKQIAANTAVVDHCHTTGRNRGILCCGCNKALGFLRDDPELLRVAAAYLETACASS